MADIFLKDVNIKDRLPIWWNEDLLSKVISEMSEEYEKKYIIDILSRRVEQPIQVWKTAIIEKNNTFKSINVEDINSKIKFEPPFYKTKGRIGIYISKGHNDNYIENLIIKNGSQWIKINGKINSNKIIYNLKNNELHIDDSLTNYEFETYPIPKISNDNGFWEFYNPEIESYEKSTEQVIYNEDGSVQNTPVVYNNYWYIFDKKTKYKSNSIIEYFEDEFEDNNLISKNKIEIEIIADEEIISTFKNNYMIGVELEKPCFNVEQNINLSSLIFLPLKKIKMYGLYDFKYNSDENGWKFLFEKEYPLSNMIVGDMITKQFPVDKFYVEVYFHGLSTPISIGFPQQEESEDLKFLINPNLDIWGDFYEIPRRKYKENISVEDGVNTNPEHYTYPIEQDYYYQKRLLNEYVWNEDSIDSLYLKDTSGNSLIRLQCVDPFVEDLVVASESKEPNNDIYIEYTDEILTTNVEQLSKNNQGVWLNLDNVKKDDDSFASIHLNSKTGVNISDLSYESSQIRCSFDLENKIPDNSEIIGIKIYVDQASNESYTNKKDDDRTFLNIPKQDKIISIKCNQSEHWNKNRKKIVYGEKDYLFEQTEITKEQLTDERFSFNLGITNDDISNSPNIGIYGISIQIFYKILNPESSIHSSFKSTPIYKNVNDKFMITLKNEGKIPILNKKLNLITSNEIEIVEINEINDEIEIPYDISEDILINSLDINDTKKIEVTFKGINAGYYDIFMSYNENFYNKKVLVLE